MPGTSRPPSPWTSGPRSRPVSLRGRGRPGKAVLVLLLLILGILAAFDLGHPGSTLKGYWHSLIPGQSQGEQLRDEVVDVLNPRR